MYELIASNYLRALKSHFYVFTYKFYVRNVSFLQLNKKTIKIDDPIVFMLNTRIHSPYAHTYSRIIQTGTHITQDRQTYRYTSVNSSSFSTRYTK